MDDNGAPRMGLLVIRTSGEGLVKRIRRTLRQKRLRLPVGLTLGPVAYKRKLEVLSVQCTDRAPDDCYHVGNSDQSAEAQENPWAKDGRVLHHNAKYRVGEERGGADDDGLPGVKASIGAPVVRCDCQEHNRWNQSEVADCADRVFRNSGVDSFRQGESSPSSSGVGDWMKCTAIKLTMNTRN